MNAGLRAVILNSPNSENIFNIKIEKSGTVTYNDGQPKTPECVRVPIYTDTSYELRLC